MVSRATFKLRLVILIGMIKYHLKSLWQKYYFGYKRPKVQLKLGKLRGLTDKLPNGEPYHFFKGIPYAKPPVGPLRFQPPVPIQRYDGGMIDCSVHRNESIQLNFLFNTVAGSEDGLYLNVYTPELPDSTKSAPNLPVMIFIHGGGFQDGSGDSFLYDPVDLVAAGVIVVTINYRLGPLGFLCLPSVGVYGNMGLKDQRLAFQWVQENIAQFGGNPNNVTLFGCSAGSIAAQLHYLSKNSRPAFLPRLPAQSDEEKVKQTFIQLWSSFAKNGEPSLGDAKAVEWLPVQSYAGSQNLFQLDYLNIDVKTRMMQNHSAAIALAKFIISGKLLKIFPPPVRPIVEVSQGKLRGVTTTLPNGSTYHYFKGVPYAKPPVGELRFRPPVPVEKFYKPVVDCLVDRSVCMQPMGRFVVGKEAGLYLNVFTPGLSVGEVSAAPKFPVMVWIHGGAFMSGSSNSFVYNPLHLVEEGVVVVTLNYRLGALGFLSLPSAGITGNAGLKDQLLVFKWVKQNISRFGGDSENITIFGESAGSMSAYLHYLSPNSRPVIEEAISEDSIITESPEKIFKSFDTIRMPLINGCTDSEGILGIWFIRKRLKDFVQNPESLVPQLLGSPPGLDKKTVGKEIQQFYFGNDPLGNESLDALCNVMSDNIFVTNTNVSAEWIAKYQPNVKHYHYRFCCDGKLNFTKKMFRLSQVKGASHGDELFYLFQSKFLQQLPESSDEYRVIRTMIRMWTNFAKYSDPTPDSHDPLLPFKWTAVQNFDRNADQFDLDSLKIDVKCEMEKNPCKERMELWRGYFKKYREGHLYDV
ncbi:hypothetical protein RP20_CCG020310 [Aedes albopictus]|nr:hypothetical protein RP20_CCG020310 [Aedes albopictus]